MAVYLAPFTFHFDASLIAVDQGVVEVDVATLYSAIKLAQASEEGILYDRIAFGAGLISLGGGVQVGLTVLLLGGWQVGFAEGAYIAKVVAGNLVGGPGGDPIAYSAGVQVLLIQSAASTVVTVSSGGGSGGDAPTAQQVAAAVWANGVRTLTSPSGPSAEQIAEAVRKESLMGAQDPGSIGSALQDVTGRVVGTL